MQTPSSSSAGESATRERLRAVSSLSVSRTLSGLNARLRVELEHGFCSQSEGHEG